MRRLFTAASAVAVVALLSALGAATGLAGDTAVRYALVDLSPALDETGFAQALGFAQNGAIVGAMPGEQGGSEAVVWRHGAASLLGTLGGSSSSAHDGNHHGLVVGDSLTTDDQATRAFLWDNTTRQMSDLGTLGGASSWARDVDGRGTVVGGAQRADGAVRAFRWTRGLMLDLGTLGGTTSWAEAIGDHGEVAGSAALAGDAASHAALWRNGSVTDLGTLGGASSSARDVHSRGWVVGWADRADGTSHAFRWTDGRMSDLGTLGGSFSMANGVNRRGDAVGVSTLAGDAVSAAFLWSDGQMMTLDSALVDADGWTLTEAFAIDDRGRIVAQAVKGGATHAVLLTPTR